MAWARPHWRSGWPRASTTRPCWSRRRKTRSWSASTSNQRQAALATQLFFLFQRAQQIQDLRQSDIFEPVRVADFLIEKDPLFARINLDSDEFQLYEKVFQQLTIDAPKPDLVIYLQASTDVLLSTHRKPWPPDFEQQISRGLPGVPERSVQ